MVVSVTSILCACLPNSKSDAESIISATFLVIAKVACEAFEFERHSHLMLVAATDSQGFMAATSMKSAGKVMEPC